MSQCRLPSPITAKFRDLRMDETSEPNEAASASSRPTPRIGNINSPSVSLASSEDGSNGGHDRLATTTGTMASTSSNSDISDQRELSLEVRRLTDSLTKLRRVFEDFADRPDAIRKAAHERLGDVLKILRQMLERYPSLQTQELVDSASHLIGHVKHFNYDHDPNVHASMNADLREFHETLDALTGAVSSKVSEYSIGNSDLDTSGLKSGLRHALFPYGDTDDDPEDESNDLDKELLLDHQGHSGVDQIDTYLMRHDLGVDLALDRAKVWSKYAKDVLFYVEKRLNLEMDWAKNLTKLAQERRPVLKEESHLPFQSIYCFALDIDLEMCASTQTTCALLEDYKFLEPLRLQRDKHERNRKKLKERWKWERKKLQEVVLQLNKAQGAYYQRHQEYERCREALRIAEQGAEIGATGENKVEKRKRLEEDALQKTAECETHYRSCVDEANERHRHIQLVKTDILREVREMTIECDRVMKEVTVNYFQLLHSLSASVPTQYSTMCESSRLYEPGSQFMEYVKRLPQELPNQHTTMTDPFRFEPFSGDAAVGSSETSKRTAKGGRPFAFPFEGSDDHHGRRGREAWTPSMGAIEPSDTESVESGRSSPSGSPLVGGGQDTTSSTTGGKEHPVIYFDSETSDYHRQVTTGQTKMAKVSSSAASSEEHDHGHASAAIPTSPTTPPRRQMVPMSKAAVTHRFKRIKHPSTTKCRECDNRIGFTGYICAECGLSSHMKCLETLTLLCVHRRLPRKVPIFGVDLSNHVLETGNQVPPIVIRCVQEINSRGLSVQGIYRVSGAKQRIDRLSQAFENGPELVDLTNIPPNVIADVLKNYMRQLPEPLLTTQLSPEFIRVAEAYPAAAQHITSAYNSTSSNASTTTSSVERSSSDANAPADTSSPPPNTSQGGGSTDGLSALDDDQKSAINRLRELTRRLPKAHYHTIAYLMHHLSRVAAENESNSMTASNLAIVFAPTLMKTSQESIGMGAVGETKHHARVIELLIAYVNYVFGPAELHMPHTNLRNDHHPRVQRPRGTSSRNRSSRDNSDLISSQTERRNEVVDEFNIPGLVSDQAVGSTEDIYGASVSDDDDDAEPIPLFLLPDSDRRPGKSPLLLRGNSSPPKIIRQDLKNFSGLEGITPGMLSTQDSLEVAQQRVLGSTSTGSPALTSSASLTSSSSAVTAKKIIHHETSMPVASTSEISTAVFHKVNQRVTKKNSVDEDFFDIEGVENAATASDVVDGIGAKSPQISTTTSSTNSRPSVSNSASTSSARSGSLSEEGVNSSRRRAVGQAVASRGSRDNLIGGNNPGNVVTSSQPQNQPQTMSQSMPATILNLEENRVTIQVPGVQSSSVQPRTSQHPTVVKQSSADKEDD